ncbi:MAG: DUF1232 domain-containing protein [Acidobacteria bacterium]|nr:DUF1232 domain-containing protein [Acidobacteriota bacterium]MBI3423662.1 DUF1232 domain-containing protein [Acidobacteriota bacterium]
MTENLNQAPRHERHKARGFLHDALMLIPNFLKLLYRLFKDSRVPTTEKAFLVGAIIYVISPLDLIPDVIPFIGEVDDLYLVALTVLRLLNRAPDLAIREHWEGRGDVVGVVDKIVRAAQYVLPKRVQRILLGQVEIAPKVLKGGMLASPAAPEQIEPHIQERERRAER